MRQDLKLCFYWAGSTPFEKSLLVQEKLKMAAKNSIFCFYGFEPSSPVISLGLKADKSHVLWSKDQLKQKGISLFKVKRGGEACLHSPGQLVIYPIMRLPLLPIKVKDFISALEQISQSFLKSLGVKSHKEGKTAGLYSQRGKIGFFGLHISEGVSGQGLSINVRQDLSLLKSIKSCGMKDRPQDQLSLYPSGQLSLEELFFNWCEKAFQFFNQIQTLSPTPQTELDYFIQQTRQ